MRLGAPFATAMVVAFAGAACASGGAGASGRSDAGEQVPASTATVMAVAESRNLQHRVFVRNRSTVPIIVSGVMMRDCVNLGFLCDDPGGYQQIIRVQPGQTEEILRTVSRADPYGPFGYRVSWTWRPDVGDLRATTGLTREELTITSNEGRMTSRRTLEGVEVSSELYPPAVAEALRRNLAQVRVQPDSIDMRVGESRELDSFRVELVDAAGGRLGPVPFGFRISATQVTFRHTGFTAMAPGRVVIDFTVPRTLLPAGSTPPAPGQLVVNVRP